MTVEWMFQGKLEAVDLGVTSDYLCSYSSDRLLTDSDVEGYLNANYSEYNFPEGINIIQMIINRNIRKTWIWNLQIRSCLHIFKQNMV